MDGAICISSRSVVIGGCRCSTRRRVAQVHFFSFLLTAPPMRDSTVALHRTVKKRGVPHASGLRVGVCILPSQSIWSADNNWEQRHPKPHTSNRCVGHPNHLFTWCPDHLPRHPVAARSGQSGFSKDLSYSVLLTLRGLPIL